IGVREAASAVCKVVNERGVGDGHSASFGVDGEAAAIGEAATHTDRSVAVEGGAINSHRASIVVKAAAARSSKVSGQDAVDEGQRTTIEDRATVENAKNGL